MPGDASERLHATVIGGISKASVFNCRRITVATSGRSVGGTLITNPASVCSHCIVPPVSSWLATILLGSGGNCSGPSAGHFITNKWITLPLHVDAPHGPGLYGPPRVPYTPSPYWLEPGTHFLEPFHLLRFDPSIGHRADVEQQVAVAADDAQQRLQALHARFRGVVRFPRPLLCDRHAGFPGRSRLKPPICCSGVS